MTNLESKLLENFLLAGLPEPEREYRFHKDRKWRFDFAWPAKYLAVEVEGGVWSGGRHTTGAGFTADCVKYNAAAMLGWRVLRFTSTQINSGEALEKIEEALKVVEKLGAAGC
jgi:very-short-patch-repair endonuclease